MTSIAASLRFDTKLENMTTEQLEDYVLELFDEAVHEPARDSAARYDRARHVLQQRRALEDEIEETQRKFFARFECPLCGEIFRSDDCEHSEDDVIMTMYAVIALNAGGRR